MFEIGNTLREARLRKGLGILECEDQTKIRAKYLRALEDEEFDALPSGTYVRGFLRTYAEFLGLDARLVTDEHDSRFGGPEGEGGGERPPRGSDKSKRKRRRRGVRSEVQLLWLAIGGVMGVALLVWMGASGPTNQPLPEPAAIQADGELSASEAADGDIQPAAAEPGVAGEGPRQLSILLRGTGGGSWVQVRGGDEDGREVYRGTLREGEERRFGVQRGLWVRIGNTGGLDLEVDGEEQDISGGVADVLITQNGLQQLAEYE